MLLSRAPIDALSTRLPFAATSASATPHASARSTSMKDELLPFTVRMVREEEDVRKAVSVRHAAYARHVPVMAEKLVNPEATDFEDGVAVLLAESKLDGAPLGTMRIQTNRFKALSIEQSIELPDWLKGRPLAEASRLGVELGRTGTFVKTVLFKAFYLYCVEQGIDYMVIAARSPLDRQYDKLMFSDIFPGAGFMPMRHGGNLPHRALSFEVRTAEQRWASAAHPMFDFIFTTRHADINLHAPAPAAIAAREPALPLHPGSYTRSSAGLNGRAYRHA